MREKLLLIVGVIIVFAGGGLIYADATDLDDWVFSPTDPATGQPIPAPEMVAGIAYTNKDGSEHTDVVHNGTGALHLGDANRAWYRFADEPVFGRLEFWVYDRGASQRQEHSHFGPRWGVMNNPAPNPIPATGTPNDEVMGMGVQWKSFYDGNFAYALFNGWPTGSSFTNWFSLTWPGAFGPNDDRAYRRVSVDPTRLNDGSTPQTGTPVDGQGAWSKWVISIHEDEDYTMIIDEGLESEQVFSGIVPQLDSVFDTGYSSTGFNQIFLFGGTGDVAGVWIDDMSFTPDPGQGVDAWSFNFDPEFDICAIRGSEGDFNCDGMVGLLDLDVLGNQWMTQIVQPCDKSYESGDANGDCEVGLLDLDILGQNWGQPTSIPEPASIALLALAGVLVIRRR